MEYTFSNIQEVVEQKLQTRGGKIDILQAYGALEREQSDIKLAESLGIKEREYLVTKISDDFVIVGDRKEDFRYRPIIKDTTKDSYCWFSNINQAIMYGIMIKNATTHMYTAVCKLTGEED
jgi:hypothetical protein